MKNRSCFIVFMFILIMLTGCPDPDSTTDPTPTPEITPEPTSGITPEPTPAAGELQSGVTAYSSLDTYGDSDMWYIDVPVDIGRMSSTLVSGMEFFNLYGKHGSPPTTNDYDWRKSIFDYEDAANFYDPEEGRWYIMVTNDDEGGAYGLTVTLIEATPIPTQAPTPIPTAVPTEVPFGNETKITASDGTAVDCFGKSVALSQDGTIAIVGAPGDDDNGSQSGSVYFYRWNGTNWEETKLIASDGAGGNYFGEAVSLSQDGNTAAVGAYWDNDNGSQSGSSYIFQWNGTSWDETKLIASDGAAGDYFGKKISLSPDGNTVAVGAYMSDDHGDRSGSVYIYKWNGSTWEETKFTASDAAADDRFGCSLSLSRDGNTLAVGAFYDDDKGSESGSAYIYKWDGINWEETKLIASDGGWMNQFGHSISLSYDGNTVVVGAYADNDNGSSSGSIYIYGWDGTQWNETKIIASDGETFTFFGTAVSLSRDGHTVAVGASYISNTMYYFNSDPGSVYVYKRNGTMWDEIKIVATDGAGYDYFGETVSLSADGSTVLVGAFSDDDDGSQSGSVYIYK